MTMWPEYLVERACSPPPPGCGVVAGSTPVLFFGNPEEKIATIGINPSYVEFLDDDSALLSNNHRRLATLQSLGIQRYHEIDEILAHKILTECTEYFENHPYMKWFGPLDRILRGGLGASYCEGTACHLDLAQWATSPTWGGLTEDIQKILLDKGIPFLVKQLQKGPYRLVLVNGKAVKEEIENAGLVTWEEVGQLEGPPAAKLYKGKFGNTRFLAWSCNLQSQPGAMRHIPDLVNFVAEYRGEIGENDTPDSHKNSPDEMNDTHDKKEDDMKDSCKRWPAYLVERARRPPPPDCRVVPNSTPVVCFGNPSAKIATISINPSYMEFREQRGLFTLESGEEIDECTGAKIIDGCAEYFKENYYKEFFLPLDCILRNGAHASFFTDDSSMKPACHLDLAQWATLDIWSDLPESAQQRLLGDGLPFLIQQIRYEKYRLVIANGRTVKDEIEKTGLIEWNDANPPEDPPPSVDFYEARFGDTQFFAWSCFVKYAPKDTRNALARFVKEHYTEFQTERKTP